MKKLYRWNMDCGRHGDLGGLFIGDSENVEDKMLNYCFTLSDCLGKHSEIEVEWTSDLFKVIDIDQESLLNLEKQLGQTWSGINLEDHYLELEIFEGEDGYEHDENDRRMYINKLEPTPFTAGQNTLFNVTDIGVVLPANNDGKINIDPKEVNPEPVPITETGAPRCFGYWNIVFKDADKKIVDFLIPKPDGTGKYNIFTKLIEG